MNIPEPVSHTNTQSITATTDSGPWYKQKFLWMVLGLPAVAVIACIGFVVLSFSTADDLVRDDWYMDGKTLYQDVSRDKLAADKHLSALLVMNDDGKVQLQLQSPEGVFPKQLHVDFFHATQKNLDKSIQLRHIRDGQYIGDLARIQTEGNYYIEVSGDEWRLRTKQVLPLKFITLKPLPVFD